MVLVIGLALVVVPAFWHLGQVARNPFVPPQTSQTVVTSSSSGGTTTQTTTREATRSFVERALGPGGLLLLRIGIAALAAFLSAAVVQRMLIGDFAMKLGPVEVPALKEAAAASSEALDEVVQELRRQAVATERAITSTADTAEGLAALSKKVANLERVASDFLNLLNQGEEGNTGRS